MAVGSTRTMVLLLEEYSARVFLEEFIFRAFPVLDDNLSGSFRAFVTGVGGLIQRMSAAETR